MSDTPDAQVADPAQAAYAPAATRPNVASRKSRRGREQRKVTRYTLDLEHQQHLALRSFALVNGVEASRVCRALLFLLDTDPELRERVLDEIFAEDDVESNFTPDA